MTLTQRHRNKVQFQELRAHFDRGNAGPSPLAHCLRFDDAGAIGCYGSLSLRTVFQPLFSARTLQAMAYEALLRAHDAALNPIAPRQAFDVAKVPKDIIYFDRLCRTVHAVNFAAQAESTDMLYLNVDGRLLLNVEPGAHGSTFETLLGYCGLEPSQVALEVLESRIGDLGHLVEAVGAYQQRGFRVAIDDFGCQHSNFDRLWRLSPDIVKLDRSLIVHAALNPRAKTILPKLVEIIHDLGAEVVCEGIETIGQHALAVDAGVDLLQGYLYARPGAVLQRTASSGKVCKSVCGRSINAANPSSPIRCG